jgi:hypothetical protein
MTRGLEDALNLRPLEEALSEAGHDPDINNVPTAFDRTLDLAEEQIALIEGKDHAEAMDTIYEETIKHARDLVDFGFNTDPARARGMFEQGANMYKIALDAKNAKRRAQLDAMKLALEQRKAAGTIDEPTDVIQGEAVMHDDRNAILARLHAQIEQEKNSGR